MDRPAATTRALALLAALASPVFMAAAVAGWVAHVWPATPLTLGAAAVAVLAGPALALAHVATARVPAPPSPPPPAAPPPRRASARHAWAMTPARARSLAFLAWRDQAPAYVRPVRSRARRRTVSTVRPGPKHDHLA